MVIDFRSLNDSCGAVIKKGQEKSLEQSININNNISAPIYEGQIVGNISYSINGENVGSVDIVAKNNVKKISFWNITTR